MRLKLFSVFTISRVTARWALCGAGLVLLAIAGGAPAQDVSRPPTLQWFETPYEVIDRRMPDVFMAGYDELYLPPPGRADSGDQSAGYDAYDRFDLGTPDNETLYGTEQGLKNVADAIHRMGGELQIDAIVNHTGFTDKSTPGFLEAGGYPGYVLQDPDGDDDPFGVSGTDGDFHSPFASGRIEGRLAGLVDIDYRTNHQLVRHPVPGFEDNIPAGQTPLGTRLANVPRESNRQFYPDRDLEPIRVFDPKTGEQDIAIYPFNTDNPMAGDPVKENAMGYTMRYMQWMVQVIGVDNFRVDAVKHMRQSTLEYIDRAVYRQNPRENLDGSTNHVRLVGEVLDGDKDFVQQYIRQDIHPNRPGRIGGNRDATDFPLQFALNNNLSGNGLQNDWRNVLNAGMDVHDDGLHNGSQGVRIVSNHDNGPGGRPDLSNVAHAYTLMHPGPARVYLNGRQFGNRDFPHAGRGDALGGVFGDAITNLVNIRSSHGRGDFLPRLVEKETLAFEREQSAVVLLSNRSDGGFDARTIQTNFEPGTHLMELTGNASSDVIDPFNDLSEVVTVQSDGTIDVRVPRNRAPDGDLHQSGYLVYGPATPQSDKGVQINNVAQVLEGNTPEADAFENGNTRLSDLHVVDEATFTVKLATEPVRLLGLDSLRDRNADGDNALIRVDGGLDINGNDAVDFVEPDTPVTGFEEFLTENQPGFSDPSGEGLYRQRIDTDQLSEGRHYITVRAFRHREGDKPALFSDFRKVIYVDRKPPVSTIGSFDSFDGQPSNRDLIVRNTDQTADSVHVFKNLYAGLSDAEVLARVGEGNAASAYGADQYKYGFFDVQAGNNALTVVTFEPTGNRNVQRFVRQSSGFGAGLADVDGDDDFDVADVTEFETVLWSPSTTNDNDPFHNPAADLNGDGWVDTTDLLQLPETLQAQGAVTAAVSEAEAAIVRRGNVNLEFGTDQADINRLFEAKNAGNTRWLFDLNRSGVADAADVTLLVEAILDTDFGDTDLDGVVNLADLRTVADQWQSSLPGPRWELGDVTGDGFVGPNDLDRLRQNWGGELTFQQALNQTAIPEPGTLLGLGTGLLLLMRGRPHNARRA
jgi:hypothetical protein